MAQAWLAGPFGAGLLAASAAQAACVQEKAVYGDAGVGAEIVFADDLHPAEPLSHRFTLRFPEPGLEMDGMVMLAGEPVRPWGMVMYNCPEGDATGAEIDACTIWEGPIHSVDGSGAVGDLPDIGQHAEAVATVRLAGFSTALEQSQIWRDSDQAGAPQDDFRLKDCRQ